MIRMNALVPVPTASDRTSGEHAGHLKAETADRLVERLNAAGRQSTAEMLQELRRAFPDSPLAVRVRALEALRKR
jgi:hypothetical protein